MTTLKKWDILKIEDKLEGLRKRWREEVDNRPIIQIQARALEIAKEKMLEKKDEIEEKMKIFKK